MVFTDAPTSGGINGARAGTLTFMIGCEDEHLETVTHLLNAMGPKVFHCGPPGYGLRAKVCNNLILGMSMVATSESLAMGKKLGVD
mmetsp:Transcript_28029/g.27051  ORF Transcript_28029/g.27051 Transcript_28029/m.27051 type:complete len:86 (+) Transcript_28029:182-439(+)